MRDEETGSWWQQVTGEAIFGPLKGRQLKLLNHDELSFDLWRLANSNGRVLRPNDEIVAKDDYAPPDWDERMDRVPVVTAQAADDPLRPRALVVGVSMNHESKAYPISTIKEQGIVIDVLGGTPIMILVAPDGKSVRGYKRTAGQQTMEFFLKPDSNPLRLVDSTTGSEWDFWGNAIAGASSGQQLEKIYVLKDYWFDWKAYHPSTSVYHSESVKLRN